MNPASQRDPSTRETYDFLARTALQAYPLYEYTLEYLRHNENLTYKVQETATNTAYLLRIHFARIEGFRGIQQTTPAIESELAWLCALKQDTTLLVQQPVRNLRQEYVTLIPMPATQASVPCSLLTWLEADPASPDDFQNETFVRKLGHLTATLHEHAKIWNPPPPFLRLIYDANLLQTALNNLQEGVRRGIILERDLQHLQAAGTYILSLFETIPRTPDNWGLIHADLMSGNVLVREGNLIPIDFSLSGFGYYLLDLGMVLCNLKPAWRPCFLDGYGLMLTDESRHQIEAWIIMMVIVSAAAHLGNPDWQNWFQRRFPVIANIYGAKLLRREAFFFEI